MRFVVWIIGNFILKIVSSSCSSTTTRTSSRIRARMMS